MFIIAGAQSGKTSFIPWWLHKQIQRTWEGGDYPANDYLATSASNKLFNNAFLPSMIKVFVQVLNIGYYWAADSILELKCLDPDNPRFMQFYEGPNGRAKGLMWGRIVLISAQGGGTLESMTAKAAVLDECVAPETMIATEIGDIPISVIVNSHMPIRVWSFNTENNTWELKPIKRWIQLKQKAPLLKLGKLNITGNHKVWTKEQGYIALGSILNREEKEYHVLRAMRNKVNQSTEKVLQPRVLGALASGAAWIPRGYIKAYEKAIRGGAGAPQGDFRASEGAVFQSGESSLGATWGRALQPPHQTKGTEISANARERNLEARRQWQAEELATGETSTGPRFQLEKRVCGDDRERMFATCLQNRYCRANAENSHRGWEQGQRQQGEMVRTEWVGISSLFKSNGRDLDGWLSSDGCVYNLGVEGNHNYIANNILVSNCGQDGYTLEDWEAISRRTAVWRGMGHGRILGATTPYNLGWLYENVYQSWLDGDPDIDVFQFPSYFNPNFPMKEYERAKKTMPKWRFEMFYNGRFERPAGLIYHDFDPGAMLVGDFDPPPEWERVVGVDFGGANTATLWLALNPSDGRWYAYYETLEGHMPTSEHTQRARDAAKGLNRLTAVGGSPGETQQRKDWWQAGFFVEEPLITDVEAGIDRVTAILKLDKLRVCRSLENLRREFRTYRRKLDESNRATEVIMNKGGYHGLDCLRAAATWIEPGEVKVKVQSYSSYTPPPVTEGFYERYQEMVRKKVEEGNGKDKIDRHAQRTKRFR